MPSEVSYIAVASQYQKACTTAQTLSALGFTAAQIDAANVCQFSVDTQAIRYTYDGTTPTASIGHPVAVAGNITITGNGLIRQLQFIQQVGGALVNITLQTRL